MGTSFRGDKVGIFDDQVLDTLVELAPSTRRVAAAATKVRGGDRARHDHHRLHHRRVGVWPLPMVREILARRTGGGTMSSQMKDLARRAVACKHWRWLPGMRCVDTTTGMSWRRSPLGWQEQVEDVGEWQDRRLRGEVPVPIASGLDLTDPATLGCLLALVREAWGDPSLCANDAGHYDLMFWHVYTGDRNVSVGCQTEAEALVAALEAAP